jgi:hypothetical protein
MRDYGKVQSTFWTSNSTRSLSDDGRMLALYLLTGNHTNQIGCFRLPDGYVCEDLSWTKERVLKGFVELFNNGFATRDMDSKWVFIHKYLKWNIIENPNQAKSAVRLFDQVPNESIVKPLLAKAFIEFSNRINDDDLKGFETVPDTVKEPFRNQEQEHYQEQDQKQDKKQSVKNDYFDQFWKLYPRHEAKANAQKAWDKIKPDEILFHGIMDGLAKQIKFKWTDPKFIPHPTTWLNGGRWTDDVKDAPFAYHPEQEEKPKDFFQAPKKIEPSDFAKKQRADYLASQGRTE